MEKQALLERDGLLDRCRSLIELLEMKVLAARHTWDRDGATRLQCSSRLVCAFVVCSLEIDRELQLQT